jgi:hypothetical protein
VESVIKDIRDPLLPNYHLLISIATGIRTITTIRQASKVRRAFFGILSIAEKINYFEIGGKRLKNCARLSRF